MASQLISAPPLPLAQIALHFYQLPTTCPSLFISSSPLVRAVTALECCLCHALCLRRAPNSSRPSVSARQSAGDEPSPPRLPFFHPRRQPHPRRHLCSLSLRHAAHHAQHVFRREDAVLCGQRPRPGPASATHCESRGTEVGARACLLSPSGIHCVCGRQSTRHCTR
jgi:hypothetical protein